MPNVTVCPGCESPFKVPAGAEGRMIRCPSCKAILLVSHGKLSLADAEEAGAGSGRGERSLQDEEEDRPRRSRRRADPDEDDEEDLDIRLRKRRRGQQGAIPIGVWIAGGVGGVVFVGLLLFLVLKASNSPYDRVKPGMSESEVREIMGTPDVSALDKLGNGTMQWGKFDQDLITIYFENGKVSRKEKIAAARKDFGGFR